MSRELYDIISAKLDRIDFNTLWPGFRRVEFALYNSTDAFLRNRTIPRDERFFGNTSIAFEGQHIAIWNIEPDTAEDTDLLTACIVHEMFHAFQNDSKERRFPYDLATLTYPYNVRNYELKFEENTVLAAASQSADTAEKIRLLTRFCGIRKMRQLLIGAMTDSEYLTETAEGMAEYVGTLALKELSPTMYFKRMAEYAAILRCCDNTLLDIRRISYYSGALLLITARDAGLEFYHSITEENLPVFSLIAQNLTAAAIDDAPADGRIQQVVEDTRAERKAEVKEFLQSERAKIPGDFHITGYDPMNMIRADDFILCKTFVRLTAMKTNTAVSLLGETLLEMADGSVSRVRSYYR